MFKKQMMKQLLSNKKEIVNKMTLEYKEFLSYFQEDRTIGSIKIEEIVKFAEIQFKKLKDSL